jgi:hypothetical protein
MTMYNTTDVSSVPHGTVIAEMPSSSPTSGAKATTMIVSLSDLRQCKKRIAVGEPTPDEHHGRARGGGE